MQKLQLSALYVLLARTCSGIPLNGANSKAFSRSREGEEREGESGNRGRNLKEMRERKRRRDGGRK